MLVRVGVSILTEVSQHGHDSHKLHKNGLRFHYVGLCHFFFAPCTVNIPLYLGIMFSLKIKHSSVRRTTDATTCVRVIHRAQKVEP